MVMATGSFEHFTPTINFVNGNGFVKSHVVDGHQAHDNGVISKQLIGDALGQRVEGVDHEMCQPGDEDAFFVGDLGEVYRQHLRWKMNLPRVKPFYGMYHATAFRE
jgi:ornithine decarboxylase